jgi:hypothetical protein
MKIIACRLPILRPPMSSGFVSILALFAALAAPQLNAQEDSCQLTANDVLTSCQTAAQSDYHLALANCDNVSKRGAQKNCRDAAADELAAALQTCTEQHDARAAACQRFGPAPYDPVIKPSNFVSGVNHPYFPLPPGTTYIYEGQTADGFEHDEFAVTHNTRTILGVTCVEVHDTVTTDGELTEDTLDWFAQDKDGNVWYFGENTHELEDGLITTIDGTFMAGVDSAKPGIIMKAHPAVGDFYRQEFSLANAEDYAETLSLDERVVAGGRTYTNCLQSQETTPLETDLLEFKYYAPGVGNVLEVDGNTGDRLELVGIRSNPE